VSEAFPQELFALLGMAEFGQPGEPESLTPKITQEALADMIGITPSRVSYFMNRFRQWSPHVGPLRSDAAAKHCEEATRSGGS
jgi:hypothetical protein